MRKVVISATAEKDLHNILFYIAQHNKGAALRLNETIYAKIQLLKDNPFIYRAGRVADTREMVVGNYVAIYRIGKNSIRILRVLHGAQNWPIKQYKAPHQ